MSNQKPEPERRVSRTTVWAAVIVGVVLSTLAFVQISSMLRGGDGVALIAGLALGTVVAGVIVRARGWRDWLAVGVRVVLAQLLVGVVVFLLIAFSLSFRGV